MAWGLNRSPEVQRFFQRNSDGNSSSMIGIVERLKIKVEKRSA